MVKVSRRKPNDVVLLEPLDQLSSLNLVAAKSLVQVKNSRGFFKIMNPTDKKIRIPFNNLLAVICVVDDTSVSDFDGPVSSFEHQSKSAASDIFLNLNCSSLSKVQKSALEKFLTENRDVLAKDLSELSQTNV